MVGFLLGSMICLGESQYYTYNNPDEEGIRGDKSQMKSADSHLRTQESIKKFDQIGLSNYGIIRFSLKIIINQIFCLNNRNF